MQTPVTEEQASSQPDRRLTAIAAALLLAMVVGVVAFPSAGGTKPAPIPAGCLGPWNGDPEALIYGRHDYLEHEYEAAQVLLLDRVGEPAARRRGGRCAVVFPASGLDREPYFAGQRHTGRRWVPLSKLPGVTKLRLSELQTQAQSVANVILRPDGTLRRSSGVD